jgi:hypothetical protein
MLLLGTNTVDAVNEALQMYSQTDDSDLVATIGERKCYLRLDRQRDATTHLKESCTGNQLTQTSHCSSRRS